VRIIGKRIFTWLFILMFTFSVSSIPQDDDVTIQLDADTMYIIDNSTLEIEVYAIDDLLVFTIPTLTIGKLVWTTFGEAEVYNELGMFSIYATDEDDKTCKLWFMFENLTLYKIWIEYNRYSFIFEYKTFKRS